MSRVFQLRLKGVQVVLRGVQGYLKEVLKVCQGSFKSQKVLRVFQHSFKGISRKIVVSFQWVSRVFD